MEQKCQPEGWDCKDTECSFYEVRPKNIYFQKKIPRKFQDIILRKKYKNLKYKFF